MKQKRKIKLKNPSQITFEERNFHQTGSRLKSYQNVQNLLDRLKIKTRERANHLSFEHATKIFEIEEALENILEVL